MPRIFLFTGAILLLLSSCSKNGEPIEQMKHTSISLTAMTVDTLILQVELDDATLISRTTAPSVTAIPIVKYIDPTGRLRVRNLFDNRIMLDTTITFSPFGFTPVYLVQTGANSNIVIPGPAANEPAPPAGRTKIAFVYVAAMPDEVKVVAENSQSGASELDYVPTDSFLLHKGQFSPYVPGWSANGKKPRLKVYTSDAQRTFIAEFKPGLFYQAQSGISFYSLEMLTSNFTQATKIY